MFSNGIGVRDSNEAEVLAILKAMRIFSSSFQGCLIMESDSSSSMSWVSHTESRPWKLHSCFNKIMSFFLDSMRSFIMWLDQLIVLRMFFERMGFSFDGVSFVCEILL